MANAVKKAPVHEQVRAIRANMASAEARDWIAGFLAFLEASEYQLIQMMVANGIWTGLPTCTNRADR
jgi:hypothetical protein